MTNTANGKIYIGQHKYDKPQLDPNYHGSGRYIKSAYKKNPELFTEELICIANTADELNDYERYYVDKFDCLFPKGYNLKTGGDQCVYTEEARKKISENNGSRRPEVRKKMSESLKGKKRSDETRKKMSYAKKGKHLSDEHKRKLSENSAVRNNPEVRKKISESLKGENSPRYKKICPLELYTQYVVLKKSQRECAKYFNTSHTAIGSRLKQYNISR